MILFIKEVVHYYYSKNLSDRRNWTVHGIWPTKDGEIGPLNCDHSKPFDIEYVRPLLPDLRLHWTNVRGNTAEDDFWKHEWNKHGTCAMQLEPMDNEFKYFKKGWKNLSNKDVNTLII